jgi:CheY-like chemotaxis protein
MSPNVHTETSSSGYGILLCDDLLFASRILATARTHGCSIVWVRDLTTLFKQAQQRPPSGVLLDLHHPQLKLADLLRELSALCPVPPYYVAFGSHVDSERLQSARQAGCHLVLPRSHFVALLDSHLSEWLNPINPKHNTGDANSSPV